MIDIDKKIKVSITNDEIYRIIVEAINDPKMKNFLNDLIEKYNGNNLKKVLTSGKNRL